MGMMHRLRGAVGMQTRDTESPQELRARLGASSDPADVFAGALADRLIRYNPEPLARAMPEMGEAGIRWARDEDRRWADIAKTARGIADGMAKPLAGMDDTLSYAVTKGALDETVRSYGGRGPVSRHAAEARRSIADDVGNMLAGGEHAEKLAVTNARVMGHRRNLSLETTLAEGTSEHVRMPHDITRERHVQWLLDSNRAFLAMARNGLAKDDDIVAYARGAAAYNIQRSTAKGTMDRAAAAGLETPEARRALVGTEVQRSIDAVDAAAGRRVSAPFRPVEMTVIPTQDQLDAARESEMKSLPDAEWTRTGARRMTQRMEGMVVGEKAGYELREAISGRDPDGRTWTPGEDQVLPAVLMRRVSTADLQSARAGRIETIEDEAFRLTMKEIVRDNRQVYDPRTHEYGHHVRQADKEAEAARNPKQIPEREPGSLIRRSPVPIAARAAQAGSLMSRG
jgi:hypothetical protein